MMSGQIIFFGLSKLKFKGGGGGVTQFITDDEE